MLEAMTSRGMCQEKGVGLKYLREVTQKCNRQEKARVVLAAASN